MTHHETDGGESFLDDPDVDVALEILRDLAAQEQHRAERGVTRARQAFALAAGFFAVVQTVSFSTFSQRLISGHERHVLLYLALVAGCALALCGAVLLLADRAFRGRAISPFSIVDIINRSRETGDSAKDDFLALYARQVEELRRTNKRRYTAVFITQALALVAIAAVLVELVYSLHTRLGG